MTDTIPLAEVGPGGPGRAVAIGTFDGVHRGHQELFRRLVTEAASRGLETVALTFDPHPLAVIHPEAAPPVLTSTEEKAALITSLGVQRVVVLPFDRARAGQGAGDFVQEVLVDRLGSRLVMEGWNFCFGRGREGTPELLTELGRRWGFDVQVLPAVSVEGETVSSTAIRQHVSQGRVERAEALLGRPYALTGEVVRGDQRGRTLGYPTANLALDPRRLLPGKGVYAVRARLGGEGEGQDGAPTAAAPVICGMANVGLRPTFGGRQVSVEVHFFDFDQDLYGRRLNLEFISKLRDERAFQSPQALVKQLDQDAAAARHILRQAR